MLEGVLRAAVGSSLQRLWSSRDPLSRDVTDHLQLLLRKSGYHLHTSAEQEVVRSISECSLGRVRSPACSLVAPQRRRCATLHSRWLRKRRSLKGEARSSGYRTVISSGCVVPDAGCSGTADFDFSLVPNGFARLSCFSTRKLWEQNTLVYIKWWSTRSTAPTSTSEEACSATLFSVVAERSSKVRRTCLIGIGRY